MKNCFSSHFIILLSVLATFSKVPDAIAVPDKGWIKNYNGSNFDFPVSIARQDDGDYIVGGYSYEFPSGLGPSQVFKLNKRGNIGFQKQLGKPDDITELRELTRSTLVQEKYVGVGVVRKFVPPERPKGWFFRANKDGVPESVATYELSQNNNFSYTLVNGVAEGNTPGEQLIVIQTLSVSGQKDLSMAIVDKNGRILSTNSFKLENLEILPRRIKKTTDGGYILPAITTSTPSNAVLLKFSNVGELQWSRKYFHMTDLGTSISDVVGLDNGEYLVTGVLSAPIGNLDSTFFVAQLHQNGTVKWEKHYNISNLSDDTSKIMLADNGSFIVAGTSQVSGTSEAMVIMKFDSDGSLIWEKSYASGDGNHFVEDMFLDGRYILLAAYGKVFYGQGESSIWVGRIKDHPTDDNQCYTHHLTVNQVPKVINTDNYELMPSQVSIVTKITNTPITNSDLVIPEECSL